ncbi:uncharacterized protein LOC114732544 [Neltuma alba]|uniref:uncharacterized protein LOC114732544 n=1 Tax=Neltuma alba TaxID=207710 RepID=UPI0010A56A6F|nr:uncharacterized protein LOC114732544 [Prosopis alba]
MGKDKQNLAVFAGICWWIWRFRCKAVFEGEDVDALDCLAKAMRLVRDFFDAAEREGRKDVCRKSCDRNQKWLKPASNMITVNDECLALLSSLEVAEARSWENVVFEMDCQELYGLLQRKDGKREEWCCSEVVQKCMDGLTLMDSWKLSLVDRKGNKAADFIAAEALRGHGFVIVVLINDVRFCDLNGGN